MGSIQMPNYQARANHAAAADHRQRQSSGDGPKINYEVGYPQVRCKILDYQKYVYQQKKKAKEMKSNASKVVIKEIRFGPNTDEHDFQFKLKHAKGFLEEGSKVKAYVFFRGRSILFSEQGEKLLLRFAVELEEWGKAEQMPKLEGKRMIMMLAPAKKKQ